MPGLSTSAVGELFRDAAGTANPVLLLGVITRIEGVVGEHFEGSDRLECETWVRGRRVTLSTSGWRGRWSVSAPDAAPAGGLSVAGVVLLLKRL